MKGQVWALIIWCGLIAYGASLLITLGRRRKADPSFIWLMALISIPLINQTILLTRAFSLKESYPILFGLRFPFQMLGLSLAYMFAHTFMRRPKETRPHMALIFAPTLLGIGAYIWTQRLHAQGLSENLPAQIFHIVVMLSCAAWILTLFYKDVHEFERDFKTQNSTLFHLRLPVLKIVWWTLIAITFLQTLKFAAHPWIELWPVLSAVKLIAAFSLVQYALSASRVFNLDPTKNSKEKLSADEMKTIADKLRVAFSDDQLYLNPNIRVADVANHLKIQPYKISATLSHDLNTNFFEFVNGYRVQHAQNLLRGESAERLNLVGIGLDSGFNSKSVFNEAFKRATGLTPSEYRRSRRPEI